MKKYFCTLFDGYYLLKGLVMLRSLQQHCPSAHIFVLCMDDITKQVLEKLGFSNLTCIEIGVIEDDELLEVKKTRSKAEYCWTLSPVLPWYIFENYIEVDAITYLDADLCFYSSLDPLFDEINDASIVIIEHRFPLQFKHMEVRGKFCVEWVGFRRDEAGLACLKRWRDQCIEWCYHRLDGNRMGDQKYLDSWPEDYSRLHILQHPGAGIAPWNYSQYIFSREKDLVTVNNFPLIFYHFHQFQILSNAQFDRLSSSYRVLGCEPDLVYQYYEIAISNALSDVRKILPDFSAGMKSSFKVKVQRAIQLLFPSIFKEFLKKFIGI
jgi:hypothetical protein